MYGAPYPYQPPPRPPPRGLSTAAIVAIVLGAVFAFVAVAVAVGLVLLGAMASAERSDVADIEAGASSPHGTASAAGQPMLPVLDPDDPAEPDEPDDDEAAAASATAAPLPTSTAKSASGSSGSPSGTRYFCNATGWVRVCGFANVCNNQMVSGIGSGADRLSASMMAKTACEGSMRARGGSGVCNVACTVR